MTCTFFVILISDLSIKRLQSPRIIVFKSCIFQFSIKCPRYPHMLFSHALDES